RREERIVFVSGAAEFRLLDERPTSTTYRHWNRFVIGEPGACVRVPAGVARTTRARAVPVVLQVLASCDYDPADDVPVPLSEWRLPFEDSAHRPDREEAAR